MVWNGRGHGTRGRQELCDAHPNLRIVVDGGWRLTTSVGEAPMPAHVAAPMPVPVLRGTEATRPRDGWGVGGEGGNKPLYRDQRD